MTSSAKPELHNTSQCRQRRTEPRPRGTKNWWSLATWFLRYARGQTDKRTSKCLATISVVSFRLRQTLIVR